MKKSKNEHVLSVAGIFCMCLMTLFVWLSSVDNVYAADNKKAKSPSGKIVPRKEAETRIKAHMQAIDKMRAELDIIYGSRDGAARKTMEKAMRQAGVTVVLGHAGTWGDWMWMFWNTIDEKFYSRHRGLLNEALNSMSIAGKAITQDQMACFDNGMRRFPTAHKQVADLMSRYLDNAAQRGRSLDEYQREYNYYWSVKSRTQADEARMQSATMKRDQGEKESEQKGKPNAEEAKAIIAINFFDCKPGAAAEKSYTITSVSVTDSLKQDRVRDLDRKKEAENQQLDRVSKRMGEYDGQAKKLLERLSLLLKEREGIEIQIVAALTRIAQLNNPEVAPKYKYLVTMKSSLEKDLAELDRKIEEARITNRDEITGLLKSRERCVASLETANAKLKQVTPDNSKQIQALKSNIERLKPQLDEKNRQIYPIKNNLVLSVGSETGELQRLLSLAGDTKKEAESVEDNLRQLRADKESAQGTPLAYISSVLVTADGDMVVKATRETAQQAEKNKQQNKKDLEEVRARKEKLSDLMKINEGMKERSFSLFQQFFQQSQQALQDVYEMRWKTFGREALVEMTFYTIDIVEAWGKKGPAGALVEAVRKGVEAYVSDRVTKAARVGSVDERSIADEINKQYNAELKDAWSMPQLEKTAVQRIVKDGITRPMADFVYKHSTEAASASAGIVARLAGRSNALSNVLNQFGSLSVTPPQPYSLSKLGKSVLKDAAKSTALHYAQQPEIDAWTDFFWREKTATVYFEFYQKAADEYWKAIDALNDCLAEEQKLISAGKGDSLKFVLSNQKPFKDGQGLLATLTFDVMSFPLGGPGKDERQEVLIGSVKAKAIGDRKFSLVAKDLIETEKGQVAVVINQ